MLVLGGDPPKMIEICSENKKKHFLLDKTVENQHYRKLRNKQLPGAYLFPVDQVARRQTACPRLDSIPESARNVD